MGIIMTKKVNAIIAAMLIIVLTFADVCVLGMNVAESFAAAVGKEQEVADEVEFSTYFRQNNENSQNIVASVDQENAKINLEIKVNSGCVQNGVIIFENANFKLVDNCIVTPQVAENEITQEMLGAVQSVDTQYGCIYLNQLSKGVNIKIEVPYTVGNDEFVKDTYFNQNTAIKFEGVYISENGENKTLSKEGQINLAWNGSITGKVDQQLVKYIPYNYNGKKGVVVETQVAMGVENNKLPIKETNAQIVVPTINNVKPVSIQVVSNSNQKVDWNNSENVLNIKVNNDVNEQGFINWNKNTSNSVNVICKYDENVYNTIVKEDGSFNEVVLEQKVNGTVSVYNNENNSTNITSDQKLVANQKINDVISFATNYTNPVAKGYLYKNIGTETTYDVNYAIDVSNKDIVDNILLESGIDSLVCSDGTEISLKVNNVNYTKYNSTRINKSEFLNILGENGTVEIYNGDTIVTVLDNNTPVDENGNIFVEYISEIDNLRIKTSKPVNEGILNVNNQKSICNLQLNNEIVKNLVSVRNNVQAQALVNVKKLDEDTKKEIEVVEPVITNNYNKDIQMLEPVTKARLEMNNAGLSTVVENTNVELRAILKSDDVSCMLYKDPTIEIVLPEEFETINVNNVQFLFSNELNITSATLQNNENGRKVIKVGLTGTQTEYIQNNISEGPVVVINANITLNKLTPSSRKNIEMYVTNNNDLYNVNYENNVNGREYVTKTVEYIGPTGMVAGNTVVNNNNETSSVSGQENIAKTETKSESKVSTMKLTLINNNEDICTDIQILGRTPFKGNKDITTGEDLGSTFTALPVSGIRSNDIDMNNMVVYYSYKEDASLDMNDENEWTTKPEDFSKVRSYLIKLNGAMVPGAKIVFEYDVLVPNDLGFDAQTKGTYKVDYKTVSKNNVTLRDSSVATSVGIATATAPNVSLVVSSDKGDNAVVKEGEYVTYSIAATNNGTAELNNATVTSNVPAGTTYVDYSEEADYDYTHYNLNKDKKSVDFTIDSLAAGETKVFKYIVKVNHIELTVNDICKDSSHYSNEVVYDEENPDSEGRKVHLAQYVHDLSEFALDLSATANIKVSGFETTSNEYKVKATRGYLQTELFSDPLDVYNLTTGEEIVYTAKILNNSGDRDLSDVVAKMAIQQGVDYEDAHIEAYINGKKEIITDGINYDEKTRLLTANVGELVSSLKDDAKNQKTNAQLVVKVKINDDILKDKNNEEVYAQVLVNGKDKLENKDIETYYTNQIIHKVEKSELTASVVSNVDASNVLKGGDEVTYSATVTNTGSGYASNVAINDVISENGTFVSGKLTANGKETVLGAPNTVCNILAGQSVKLDITVRVNNVAEDGTLTNYVSVESDKTGKITSNTIQNNVSKTVDTVVKEDGTVVKVFKVSGTAWFDSNKNGSRDQGEKIASNVPIILINAQTGEKVAEGKTDASGKYEISNINEGGEYNIVFLYDNTRFNLTTYQKEGVDESKNSDAIDMPVTIDGKKYQAGITDTLTFNESNYYNIDVGVVENQKFDMSLTKGISKVTVNTKNGGSEVKSYDSVQMTKVEIPGKNLDGATVAVEYTIKVTNEGAIAGTVKNIVDYIPNNFSFNGELNKDWYLAENGYLYNSSLGKKILQPGESEEVKLVLVREMTTKNLGLSVNAAEIQAVSNDKGVNDFDSTPGNKKVGEDDYSTANIIVSVKTGERLAVHIEIILLIVTFMGLGIFYIRKKSNEINTNFKF